MIKARPLSDTRFRRDAKSHFQLYTAFHPPITIPLPKNAYIRMDDPDLPSTLILLPSFSTSAIHIALNQMRLLAQSSPQYHWTTFAYNPFVSIISIPHFANSQPVGDHFG
jgi:hypothetical protein